MEPAAEFPDQHKGQDHEQAFNYHPGDAAQEDNQAERQQTE